MAYYFFRLMKPKSDMFRTSYVASTYDSTYSDWLDRLERYDSKWPKFAARFAEDFQFAVLRGMAIVGVDTYSWNDVFGYIIDERNEFSGISKLYLHGELRPDWRVFAEKLAKGRSVVTYYPVIYPAWLLSYGYTQRQYTADLSTYWDNVHDDYFKLWEESRFGSDSPEVARLRRLGDVAREEIDETARRARGYTSR